MKLFPNFRSLTLFALLIICLAGPANSQQRKRAKAEADKPKVATIKGKVVYQDDAKYKVDIDEITTSLHKQVFPPQVPVPKNWATMIEEDRKQWVEAFEKSDRGKKFIADRDKLIEEAPRFKIKFDDDGEFVVYDVEPGIYGLQGRFDKEFDGITYAFELFAQIEVEKEVEQVALKPIPIEVTPLYKAGQAAPLVEVETYDSETTMTLDTKEFKGKYLFLNFFSIKDQSPAYQQAVQDMYAELGEKGNIKLLTICMDDDRKKAVKYIVKMKYKKGSFGFTDGWDHETVKAYGVRSTPSGWLIGPDRKIAMTQHEFFQAVRLKDSITDVIRDRMEGKDKPTPAEKPEE